MILQLSDTLRKSLMLVVAFCALGVSNVWAQERGSDESSNSTQESKIEDGQVYLRIDGQWVALPKMDAEQYEQLHRYLVNQAQSASSTATITSIELNGTVSDGFAEVDITIVAQVHGNLVSPVRLPIGMSRLVLKGYEFSGAFPSTVSLNKASFSGTSTDLEELEDAAQSTPDILPNVTRQLEWEIQPRAEKTKVDDTDTSNECRIVIHGSLPIQGTSARQLQFDLPTQSGESAITSKLRMILPKTAQSPSWEATDNHKINTPTSDRGLQIERIGVADTSTLKWTESGNVEEKVSTEVTSVTRLVSNTEGKPWTAVTRISLKPSTIARERKLKILLPNNSVWVQPIETSTRLGWSVSELQRKTSESETKLADGNGVALLLSISAEESIRSNSSMEIRWTWQPPAKLDQDFRLQSISVENADRHDGSIELLVSPLVEFLWQSSENGVLSRRIVESGPPELLNYVFTFSKTPVDIVCRMQEAGYRLQYRPAFLAELKENAIELNGFLSFAVDPSLMVGLEINLGPWKVKDIRWAQNGQPIDYEQTEQGVVRFFDPAGLYKRNDVTSTSATSTGRTIHAIFLRPLSHEDNKLPRAELQLPTVTWLNDQGKPITEVGNGWLAVATNDWLVEKQTLHMQSLTPTDSLPVALGNFIKTDDKNISHNYLFSPSDTPPNWTCELRRKPNMATESVDVSVYFDQTSYKIQKNWKIGQNQWKDLRFQLCVPKSIANDLISEDPDVPAVRRSSLTLDGKRISCQLSPQHPEGTTNNEAITLNAPLNFNNDSSREKSVNIPEGWEIVQPILGDIPKDFILQLTATTDLPESDNKSEISTNLYVDIELPFVITSSPVIPIDRRFEAHVNSTWKVSLESGGQSLTVLPGQTLTSKDLSGTVNRLHSKLERLHVIKPSSVRVNQIWLQTALNGSERRDRCVIDVTTAADQLELNLMSGEINNLTKVLINGQGVDPQRVEGTTSLILMLPKDSASGKQPSSDPLAVSQATSTNSTNAFLQPNSAAFRYTVELWLWSTPAQRLAYRIEENLPRITNATEPAPKYWQIVVPQHDHLWTASDSLIPEFRWKWSGLALQRTTETKEADLERMLKASQQESFGLDANRYLFSSLATTLDGSTRSTPQFVYVVPRYALFAPIGLLSVIAACMLIYFPVLRSIWTIGLAAAFGIATAAISVDLSIMLIQALAGASLLVAVLLVVHWSINSRADQRSVFANRSRISSPSLAPVAPLDFGGQESGQASHHDSTNSLQSNRSNIALGTTRHHQHESNDLEEPSTGTQSEIAHKKTVEEAS